MDGTIEFGNGDKFVGKMNPNLSFGKMVYKNGDIYEGQFDGSRRDGVGKMICQNGDIYDGEWDSDQYDGKGTIKYANNMVVSYLNLLSDPSNISLICKGEIRYLQIMEKKK
jgi:hypothetical protein